MLCEQPLCLGAQSNRKRGNFQRFMFQVPGNHLDLLFFIELKSLLDLQTKLDFEILFLCYNSLRDSRFLIDSSQSFTVLCGDGIIAFCSQSRHYQRNFDKINYCTKLFQYLCICGCTVQKFSELYEVILLAFRNISMSCEYPFKNIELGIWRLPYLKMCISFPL